MADPPGANQLLVARREKRQAAVESPTIQGYAYLSASLCGPPPVRCESSADASGPRQLTLKLDNRLRFQGLTTAPGLLALVALAKVCWS